MSDSTGGNGDLLRAGRSPQMLARSGVRRLNHIPLFICGGIFVVVALLIVWTASERGQQVAAKQEDHGGSTRDFAIAVAGDKTGYVPPERNVVAPTTVPTPIGEAPVAVATPTPNEETEARKKAFFEALFAKSVVSDPTLEQIHNAHEQQMSAAKVTKVASMDPNNLQGLTPGEIAEYVRSTMPPGGSPPPPEPNNLNTYNGNAHRWDLNTHLEAPTTPYILRTGAVIPALLLSAMESELPGTIIAQVSEDVFDTPKGEFLLIPQGSRLVGEYSNAIQYGQARIFVAWQRIIYPDGSALDIGAMPGADESGEAGFNDQVNNHFVRIFGSALLMSAITAGITYSQDQGQSNNYSQVPRAGDILSQAVGQQLGSATAALLEKNLSIAPTIKVRPGFRFAVLVVRDLTFGRPYVVGNY
jgi:type IV secretory pathway VirB10-like protein